VNVATVHLPHQRRVVGPIAERRQLLLAVPALATGDLKRSDDPIADLELLDGRSDAVDNSGEFMTENVPLLQPEDLSMVQVQVGPTDRGRGDFKDDVGVLGDVRDIGVDDLDIVGSLPGQGFHSLFATLPDLVCVLDDDILGGAGVGLEAEIMS